MKLPFIQKIVDTYTIDQLKAAEEALLNEQEPEIDLFGEDEGEQLTHCLAGIWVLEEMQKNGSTAREALRAYAQRVRKSIS